MNFDNRLKNIAERVKRLEEQRRKCDVSTVLVIRPNEDGIWRETVPVADHRPNGKTVLFYTTKNSPPNTTDNWKLFEGKTVFLDEEEYQRRKGICPECGKPVFFMEMSEAEFMY